MGLSFSVAAGGVKPCYSQEQGALRTSLPDSKQVLMSVVDV